MTTWLFRRIVAAAVALAFCTAVANAGSAVVTNGRFTNVYVLPNPARQTWEAHMAALRPTDAAQFSRASIDRFTSTLLSPAWPSYFDPLMQYSGIHPPQFFGSFVASQSCVDAAMKDLHDGVMQWDTIRSLSNCHINGMDPSPQVNLIFSPDIKIGKIVPGGTSGDMCTTSTTNAWHAWGINTPNFTAIPTSLACMKPSGAFTAFDIFTQAMSHEIVETVSDPGGVGMGNFGQHELGDNCENGSDKAVVWNGFSVARYWSNFDANCQPRLDPPAGSASQTWLLGARSPLQRFTGSVHTLDLGVPANRAVTTALLTQALLVVQTGGDDLRGGSHAGDNANATLRFSGGSTATVNINRGRRWGNGETHAVALVLPPSRPRVSDITGVTISTNFGGGISGDNWNVDKVALVVSFPQGSVLTAPAQTTVHTWLSASGGPLVRFTGSVHDHTENVAPQDVGRPIRALDLIIATGNDDLRGGSHAGDNCDVTVTLASAPPIVVHNVNGGRNWPNWSNHTVSIPLPAGGLRGGEVRSVTLHTGFGGGIGGDNWNVQQVQLLATLE